MQVELRDVDCGNKVIQRFGTDEAVESMIQNLCNFLLISRVICVDGWILDVECLVPLIVV